MVNILVAEDDRDHFLLLEEAIENAVPRYRISHSRDGKEFLRNIEEQETPDLIFLDLNLPKKSGLDCLIALRQRKDLQNTPVVIYSTSSSFEDIDLCYRAGCTLYLVKPPSFKELLVQIKKLFALDRLEEALRRADEELREEHRFLQQVTDNTPHLIYVFDLDEQRFIYINRRISDLTGIPQDYVYATGSHLFKLVLHPDDLSPRVDYFQQLARLKEGETRDNEFRIRVGEGYRRFRSKDRIFKIVDGRVTQVIGLAEDVTYEKQLQEKLAEDTGGFALN